MASFIDLQPNDSFINNEIKLPQPSNMNITLESNGNLKDSLIEDGEISSPDDRNSNCSNQSSIPSPPYSIISCHLNQDQTVDHLNSSNLYKDQTNLTINSEVRSYETFEGLGISSELIKGIRVFIDEPNDIQQAILPELLSNQRRDIFVRSRPNSGKKTSYLISAIERIDHSIKKTQVIIALPLQELVYYTFAYAQELSKYKGTTIKEIIRNDKLGNPLNYQIVISSAGCLLGCIQERLLDLSELKCLVIDEIELNLSTDNYLQKIIKLVNYCRAGQLQLYSHSFAHDDQYLNLIRKSISPDPLIYNLNDVNYLQNYLHFIVTFSKNDEKIDKLFTVIKQFNFEKVLIYSSLIETANYVYDCLRKNGFNVIVLTSRSTVQQRLLVVHKFNTNKKIILITNYPLTQGIELLDLSIVINFDLKWGSRIREFHYEYFNRISKCSRRDQHSGVFYRNLVINLINKEMRDNVKCVEMLENFYNIRMMEWKPTEK